MAAKTAAEPKASAPAENRVDITLPRAGKNEDYNAFVAINGKTTLIPKGKTSSVPYEVAFELRRAEMAQRRYDERSDALAAEAR